MNQATRVKNLEKQGGKRRGRLHVHYEDGRVPCEACEASGPPKAEDTVLTVVYEKAKERQGTRTDQTLPAFVP